MPGLRKCHSWAGEALTAGGTSPDFFVTGTVVLSLPQRVPLAEKGESQRAERPGGRPA